MFGILKHVFVSFDVVSFIDLKSKKVTIGDFGLGGDVLKYEDER